MWKLTDEQIEKAVDWWASAIVNPKFDGLSDEERADPQNDGYQLAEIMTAASHKNPTSEQLEAFKESLQEQLETLDEYAPRTLGVDYGPCLILHEAAKAAGIERNSLFPWKTNMWFYDDGRVGVSAGYRAPTEYL